MRSDCANRMNVAVAYILFCSSDNFAQNVHESHLLAMVHSEHHNDSLPYGGTMAYGVLLTNCFCYESVLRLTMMMIPHTHCCRRHSFTCSMIRL